MISRQISSAEPSIRKSSHNLRVNVNQNISSSDGNISINSLRKSAEYFGPKLNDISFICVTVFDRKPTDLNSDGLLNFNW